MTNANNIFSALFPAGGSNTGAAAGLGDIGSGDSGFAALMASEHFAVSAPFPEVATPTAPGAFQLFETPNAARPTAISGDLLSLPFVDAALPAGQSFAAAAPTRSVAPPPPETASPAPQNASAPPAMAETAMASNIKLPAIADAPKVQQLPHPPAPSERVPARPTEAAASPAILVKPVQTMPSAPEAPITPGTMLQKAQALADGRTLERAAQVQPPPTTGQPEISASNGVRTETNLHGPAHALERVIARDDAAQPVAFKANGPANVLERVIVRDDAAQLVAFKANSRGTLAIASNPSPIALNVASAVVSNVAASVPAGGSGAAAADTASLMTSQTALLAQMGESAFAGGGANSGKNGGGGFAPGANAAIGQAQAPQSASVQSAEFDQLIVPAAPSAGGVESAARTASAAPTTVPGGAGQPSAAAGEQVAVQIGLAARFGARQISLQLKPASLGEVDIELNIAKDGQVRVTVLAERQETLDLLQRDARGLERALQDAGLKSDAGSLHFGLRGEGREQRPQGQSDSYLTQAVLSDSDPIDEQSPAWAANAYNSAIDHKLDIRV